MRKMSMRTMRRKRKMERVVGRSEGSPWEEGRNGEMAPLVTPAISSNPHSPHMRKNIIYLDEGESTFSSLLKKPRVHYLGEDLNQFPPDSASIYSAPSMLSLHSAVEAESSKHDEEKVGGGGGGGGG